jgi:hypothetical protein
LKQEVNYGKSSCNKEIMSLLIIGKVVATRMWISDKRRKMGKTITTLSLNEGT